MNLLEDALAVLGALLPEDMAFDVRIAEHTVRVDLLQDTHKVVEVWVQRSQLCSAERVGFSPMRPAMVACENGFEVLEELSVWNIQAIGSARREVSLCRSATAAAG